MNFHLLHLQNTPIFEQLKLEEALLRNDTRNWILIGEGSPPAIVMGISGKKEEMIDEKKVQALGIPLIKRFSGGGTVLVDENTLFVTFICQKELHDFPAYPEPILKWSEEIYKDVFPQENFALRENDFVFGEKKFGGNAQYIKKDRWLHHTSFLWDYSSKYMDLLLIPKKIPKYRNDRRHQDFLCRLREHFSHPQEIIMALKTALRKRFEIKEATLDDAASAFANEYRRATSLLI